MTRRRLVKLVIALVLVVAGAFGVRGAWAQLRPSAAGVPTTRVQRGQVDTTIHASGEMKTTKTTLLNSPAVGGQMRLLTLVGTGTPVKANEIVMDFDPSDQQNTLEEQRAQLREAELEIEKREADAAVQAAKDKVDLLTAEFDVRKAELDVTGNELLSAIKARQNELTLEEARRRLAQLQDDIKSHATTDSAAMAVLVEKRNKAQLGMAQAQRMIDSMTVRSPIDGIVFVLPNRDGMNFGFPGMTVPDYREGDSVSSGRTVAEVLDARQLELVARVPETARTQVAAGQAATITLDGYAGTNTTPLAAKVSNVGMIRSGRQFFGPPDGPTRLMDVSLRLNEAADSMRPGLTARVRIMSDPLKNVLHLPRQAVFDRDGKPTVYVKTGQRFEPRVITITARTESTVVIDGLAEGTEVALADPDPGANQQKPAAPAGSPARMVVGQ